jgi:biotin carboxyl carrier protein
MEQWGVAELHLQLGEAAIDLVRATATIEAGEAPVAAPLAVEAAATEAAPACEPVTITAPVVGVFHRATRGFPNGGPQPGDQVQAGQLVGNIELMHVPTDLVSPVSGHIATIFVEDGAGVEYGQPLLAVLPFEEVSEDEAGMLPPPAR